MVSHEMKTPLTVIIGGLDTLLTDEKLLSAGERRTLLRDAATEAGELSRILENPSRSLPLAGKTPAAGQ